MTEKFILDPCCGPKHMWVNKNHPHVIYGDIRREKKGFNWHRPNTEINPDLIMDFRDMPFPDKSFKLVVFDPPHYVLPKQPKEAPIGTNDLLFIPPKSGPQVTHLKYGWFLESDWRQDLRKGINECWRLLEEFGILIFKWATVSKSWNDILKVIGITPLFQNTFARKNPDTRTYWATFMKLPEKFILQETLE